MGAYSNGNACHPLSCRGGVAAGRAAETLSEVVGIRRGKRAGWWNSWQDRRVLAGIGTAIAALFPLLGQAGLPEGELHVDGAQSSVSRSVAGVDGIVSKVGRRGEDKSHLANPVAASRDSSSSRGGVASRWGAVGRVSGRLVAGVGRVARRGLGAVRGSNEATGRCGVVGILRRAHDEHASTRVDRSSVGDLGQAVVGKSSFNFGPDDSGCGCLACAAFEAVEGLQGQYSRFLATHVREPGSSVRERIVWIRGGPDRINQPGAPAGNRDGSTEGAARVAVLSDG